MADGRGRAEWAQTSALLALLQNAHRAKGSRACTPADFNPFTERVAGPVPKLKDLSILKKIFVDGHKRKGVTRE